MANSQDASTQVPDMKTKALDPSMLVPAVDRAAALLRRLQEVTNPEQTGVSRLAEAIGINKSSCSYILRTLHNAGLVEFDPGTKSYSLGSALIGLGAAAARRRDFLTVAYKPVEALVSHSGLTCLLFTQLANKSFVIIGKVDSTQEIKVTIDVGQYFAPGTPALARIAMASMTESEADAYVRQYCQTQFTPATKVGIELIRKQVAAVKRNGYAVSQGEYLQGNTVVAAGVPWTLEGACRGICLIGFSSQLKASTLEELGRQTRSTAETIGASMGA